MHRNLNSPSWQQKRHDKPLCCPCDNNTLKGRSVFCFELLGLITAGSAQHREKRAKRDAWGSPWAFWHIPPFLLEPMQGLEDLWHDAQRDDHHPGKQQSAGEEQEAQLHLFHERVLLSFCVRVWEPSLPLFLWVLGERAGPVFSALLVLPGCAILAEHLLVQGTASALMPLHLGHQGANHLEGFRVLLPVVIARQVEPTEYLLPLVQGTVQVLDGSAQPEDDLVPAPTLAFVGGPGAVLECMGFPVEAPKGSAGGHQRRGSQCLLAKISPGLPDFLHRHPHGRDLARTGKQSSRTSA